MSQPGSLRSPFQEGFAALREEPLLLPAELAWRWCFALAAWMLALGAAALFLDSLKLSPVDRFLLSTLQPTLASISAVARSARHAVALSLDQVLRRRWIDAACGVSQPPWDAPPRSAIWSRCLAATTARKRRAGSSRPMFAASSASARCGRGPPSDASSASILLGTAMLQQQRAARAAFFYVFGIALSLVFGVVLNWFFGLAPLFCIREQASARDAVSLTLDFCARQGGRLFGLSLGFLALRLVWAGSMFFLVLGADQPQQTHRSRMGAAADVSALVDLFCWSGCSVSRATGCVCGAGGDRCATGSRASARAGIGCPTQPAFG